MNNYPLPFSSSNYLPRSNRNFERATNAHHYQYIRDPNSSPPRPPPRQFRPPSPRRQRSPSKLFHTKPFCQQCQDEIANNVRLKPAGSSITLDDLLPPVECHHNPPSPVTEDISIGRNFTWDKITGLFTSKENLLAYVTISPRNANEIVITTNGRDQIFNINEIPENKSHIYKPYQSLSLIEDTEPVTPAHVYIQNNNLHLVPFDDDDATPIIILTNVNSRFHTFITNGKTGRGHKKRQTKNKRKAKRRRFTKR